MQASRIAIWMSLPRINCRKFQDGQINAWLINAAKNAIRHEVARHHAQLRSQYYTDEDPTTWFVSNEQSGENDERRDLKTYQFRLKTQIDEDGDMLYYAPVIRSKGHHRRRDVFASLRARMKADAKKIAPPKTVKRLLDHVTVKGKIKSNSRR